MESAITAPIKAVFFDRDGTLLVDVPYNGDPELVQPLPGAKSLLDALRAAGLPLGIISNQSGVARGLLRVEQVEAVNARVQELLGPFAAIAYCVHGPDDGCACRKPSPKMLLDAAARLGVDPHQCIMIGDRPADSGAAQAAGAMWIQIRKNNSADLHAAAGRIVEIVTRA